MSNPGTLHENLGRLFLRIGVGGLMIFHGIHKLVTENGHGPIQDMLTNKGLPAWLWMGVPIGEVIAPVLILVGFLTRISSALVAITMVFAIYLAFGAGGFKIDQATGGLTIELNLLFLLSALAIVCFGGGAYSAYNGENKWLK